MYTEKRKIYNIWMIIIPKSIIIKSLLGDSLFFFSRQSLRKNEPRRRKNLVLNLKHSQNQHNGNF